MRISGIYKIQSVIKPERCYIGSAVNINHRWNLHFHSLRKNKHHSQKLQRHFNKYGEKDLQFSVLLGCNKEDLIKTEQYFIDIYKPYFNGSPTAGSSLGVKRTEEYKKKSSELRKGKKQSQETIQKRINKMIGHNVSFETREKIRISNTNKKHSEETNNKSREISLSQWRNPIYRQKTTQSHLGIKQSDETINKRRLKNFKPILQLDKNYNLIKEWGSIIETKEFGFNINHISSCCNKKRISSNGFKWKFKNSA